MGQYLTFGGLPKLFDYEEEEDKASYLKSIFEETYIRDIKERNDIRNDGDLEDLLNILAS